MSYGEELVRYALSPVMATWMIENRIPSTFELATVIQLLGVQYLTPCNSSTPAMETKGSQDLRSTGAAYARMRLRTSQTCTESHGRSGYGTGTCRRDNVSTSSMLSGQIYLSLVSIRLGRRIESCQDCSRAISTFGHGSAPELARPYILDRDTFVQVVKGGKCHMVATLVLSQSHGRMVPSAQSGDVEYDT